MSKYIPKWISALIIASSLSLLSGNASISQEMQNLYKQQDSIRSSAMKNCRWTWITTNNYFAFCVYRGNVWIYNTYNRTFEFAAPLGKQRRIPTQQSSRPELLTQYNIEEGILVEYNCYSRINSNTCNRPPTRFPYILNPN